jgi:integrase
VRFEGDIDLAAGTRRPGGGAEHARLYDKPAAEFADFRVTDLAPSDVVKLLEITRKLAKVKAGPHGDAFVLQTREGSPFTRFGVRSALDRAAIRAGYATKGGPRSGLTAKDLRPYATSVAKRKGYTLEQLKAGLAHTSITTTESYVQQHATPVSEVALDLPPRPDKRTAKP